MLWANVTDESKTKSSNFTNVLKQGTFCCHSWLPFEDALTKSNCMLVTLKDWTTIIIKVSIKESTTTEAIETRLKSSLRSLTSKLHIALIHSEKQSKKYHIYAHNIDSSSASVISQIASKDLESLTSNFSFSFATSCLPATQNISNDNQLKYPFKMSGKYYDKLPFKCEIGSTKLSHQFCQWNFTHGASISPLPDCDRFDQCPKNYTSVGNKLCIQILKNSSWDEMYLDEDGGDELSLLELDSSPHSELHFHLLNYLRRMNLTQIWLPLRRVYQGSSILDFSIQSLFPFMKNSTRLWAKGHPKPTLKCVVYDVIDKILRSENCSSYMDSLIMKNLEQIQDSNPQNSIFCKNGWKYIPIDNEDQICVKLFRNKYFSNKSESEEFCQSHNATLVDPSRKFVNWYLVSNYPKLTKSYWIDVPKNNLNFRNWAANTDYSNLNAFVDSGTWNLINGSNTPRLRPISRNQAQA